MIDSVRYGVGAFLHAAAGWILIACDRVILNASVTSEELGRYALAYLLAFSYDQVFQLSNQLVVPVQYRLLRNPDGGDDFVLALRAASVGVLLLAGVFVGIAPHALSIVVPERFGDVVALIAVLGAAVYWSGTYFTVVNVLFFHKRLRVLAFTTAVSALVGIVPIFFLVDRLGVMAAAWATLAGYFVHYFLVAVAARRLVRGVPIAVPVVAGLAVTGLAVSQTTAINGSAALAVALASVVVIAAAVITQARTIEWRGLRRLVPDQPELVEPLPVHDWVES